MVEASSVHRLSDYKPKDPRGLGFTEGETEVYENGPPSEGCHAHTTVRLE